MLENVWSFICRHQLFVSGDLVVVGVSGGADSMALLHVLNSFRNRLNLRLYVAHLNHGIRGEEAIEDAAFVKAAAGYLGIPCFLGEADVPEIAGKQKLSIEDAARKARYEFLFQVIRKVGGDKIAVAHNANDQAETLLLHLINGTGPEGLVGMRPASGLVVRPFLEVKRGEIEAYCISRKIPFRTDSSNAEMTFIRNRIRHQVMPVLAEYNPNIVEALLRTAEIIRGENDYIEEETFSVAVEALSVVGQTVGQTVGQSAGQTAGQTISLEGKVFARLNLALQRRLLRLLYRKLAGASASLEFSHVERIREFILLGQTGKLLDLPGQVWVEKTYSGADFYVSAPGELEKEHDAHWGEITLEVPGITCLDVVNARIQAAIYVLGEVKAKVYSAAPEEAFLDLERLEYPLTVGPVKQGDVFHPLGSSGKKKVKDFFIDVKVPVQQRKMVPVVSDSQGIVWIAGWRIDERAKVTDNTRHVLHLRINESHTAETGGTGSKGVGTPD